MHKFDIICIYLFLYDRDLRHETVNLNSYILLRADHPSNAKRRGVFIYCKETLALKIRLRI